MDTRLSLTPGLGDNGWSGLLDKNNGKENLAANSVPDGDRLAQNGAGYAPCDPVKRRLRLKQ